MVLDVEARDKTDEEVVALTLQNPDYFALLIERYQQKLLNYLRKLTNLNEDDLADVLQEVFIKIYKNLNSFDQDLKFSSWAYRISHNQVISNYRKLKARPQTITIIDQDDDPLSRLASDLDTGAAADQHYLRKNINQVLERLDLKYREVLILKYLDGKDYQEIADILQKPLGTVGTLINRAKIKFREELLAQKINF